MNELRDHEFQIAANRALLKNPEIRFAFQDCLIVLQNYIPADYISLHLFDEGLGIIETVVDATVDSSPEINKTTVLTPEAREIASASIEYIDPQQPYEIIDRLEDSVMAQQLGLDLGTPDSPSLVLDLCRDGVYLGSVALTAAPGVLYTHEHGALMALLHDTIACVVSQFLNFRECIRLRASLADRTSLLQGGLNSTPDHGVVGSDGGLKDAFDSCTQVAPTQAPVLLLGETGTGKEVLAGAIHRLSGQSEGPFVKVNCGGIPATLLESALFGHRKGAFTGAAKDAAGYFERARGGTIFLDEIGELSLEAQTRFLHVLQDGSFERVGGSKPRVADVRVVAATHRNLAELVELGAFRQDLFFRLNVFPITIPPLRLRRSDIPPLTAHFIKKIAGEMSLEILPVLAPGAVDSLLDYNWPGNVRELENVIERAVITQRGLPLSFELSNLPGQCSIFKEEPDLNFESAVTDILVRALNRSKGRIEGEGGAAEILGLHPRTLQSRLKKMGIPFGRKAIGLYRKAN
ncbi:sigma-54-dependent Fis family transcriptional regulator [Desulfovibrio sp. JC022]|uniref:sigma-54 interaction domain-containing protein n=1 Tax=Desulfovibrio sp. JC022 TaxID=2593642 RepID=UPI0013D5EE18|nr:sigma 54-interacting transcriptional regulator [Desulfovibrio sp. JC022]NDV22255.1 AAA family ATPase [Desulfovibrio sp. JC022]